jgi:hypothetical protein
VYHLNGCKGLFCLHSEILALFSIYINRKQRWITEGQEMKEVDQEYIKSLLPRLQRFEYGALIRYYEKLSIAMQVEVHRVQTDILRTRSNERQPGKQAEFTFVCFLHAIDQIRRLERAADARLAVDPTNAERTSALRSARIKERKEKAAPVRKTIATKYLLLIGQLREQGLSWRQISNYIKKYHRQTYSHSYLSRVYEESIEKQK